MCSAASCGRVYARAFLSAPGAARCRRSQRGPQPLLLLLRRRTAAQRPGGSPMQAGARRAPGPAGAAAAGATRRSGSPGAQHVSAHGRGPLGSAAARRRRHWRQRGGSTSTQRCARACCARLATRVRRRRCRRAASRLPPRGFQWGLRRPQPAAAAGVGAAGRAASGQGGCSCSCRGCDLSSWLGSSGSRASCGAAQRRWWPARAGAAAASTRRRAAAAAPTAPHPGAASAGRAVRQPLPRCRGRRRQGGRHPLGPQGATPLPAAARPPPPARASLAPHHAPMPASSRRGSTGLPAVARWGRLRGAHATARGPGRGRISIPAPAVASLPLGWPPSPRPTALTPCSPGPATSPAGAQRCCATI